MPRLKIMTAAFQGDLGPPFHQWATVEGLPWLLFFRHPGGVLLRFPALGDFQVRLGAPEVICIPAPGTSIESCRQLFANQVRPLSLGMAGHVVLHASAVEVGGNAILFVGASGLGKSTLAASFAKHGGRLIADDGLEVERRGDEHWVLPSDPSFRLWVDSEQALVDLTVPVAPPIDYSAKRRFLVAGAFAHCAQARPIKRVLFLGEDRRNGTVFERMLPREALLKLLQHSFWVDAGERNMRAAHLAALAAFSEHVMFDRMHYPRRYEALSDARRAIADHIQGEHRVRAQAKRDMQPDARSTEGARHVRP